jgi:HlyD family secretion protein
MQTQLYPSHFGEDSVESLLAEHSRAGYVIYTLIVASLLAALAALPAVRVDVSVQSAGIIRPVTGKHEVRARTSGVVESVLVRENAAVAKDQPILVLRTGGIEEEAALLAGQVDEKRRALHDLELLATPGRAAPAGLATARYRQAFAQMRNDLRESALKQDRAAREAQRAHLLGARGLAPGAEVEDRDFQLAQARAEGAMTAERYAAGWQAEAAQARTELGDLLARQGRLRQDRTLLTVTSPVAGTLEELQAVSAGSFVTAGEQVAVVSPSEGLVAEVYVSPRDIGLLRRGAPVRLQVDAFNYNAWGFATGRVEEISDDFVVVDGQPVFKVRCSLAGDHLALRNGFRGRLKKGMTLRARFVVARRSLFQLLYDDANDWLNPMQPGAPARTVQASTPH